MSVRTKVLVLLSCVTVFMASASGLALFVRGQAADALAGVAERDVPLLTLASDVTALHFEEEIRFERALRLARERDGSWEADAAFVEAREEYEAFAAAIWRRLQRARAMAEAAQDPAAVLRLVERLDHAHDACADEVRAAFTLLDEGRQREALAVARRVARDENGLRHALGDLLTEVAQSAAAASAGARRDERRASWVVGALTGMGLLLSAGAFAAVVRLVSEMKSLGGLLPICAHCKKIRDDQGYWNQLEAYLERHSDAAFTHGICTDCQGRLLSEIAARRHRPIETTRRSAS
ncbi:MAG: hypothetical protein QNK03_20840 [Myxococcota bacterium]|nr:hypothetical protein [Myxococcota bacterium]